MKHLGEIGDADEQRAQDRRHDSQRHRGVAALRRLEGRDAVGDGLGAGHGRTARGECVQDEVHEREPQELLAGDVRRRRGLQVARQVPHDPQDDQAPAITTKR